MYTQRYILVTPNQYKQDLQNRDLLARLADNNSYNFGPGSVLNY